MEKLSKEAEKLTVNTPAMETERLILRRFTAEDIPSLFVILSDREVNRFLPWFPLETLEEAEVFYRERYAVAYQQPQGYTYALCMKTDNIPIGYIGVSMGESHDLGYGMRKEFWGQGLMTEAGRAVLSRLKADGVPFVTATHDRENPRSGQVMQRLGMQYCYSYQEQWQPKNIPVVFRMYQLNLDGKEEYVYRGYWERFSPHFVEEGI